MMLTYLHKKFLRKSAYTALESILFCIPNVQPRFYSTKVKYDIPEQKRNHILSLFEDYGFTENQISSLIFKKPVLLCYGPKTLKPKLDFFSSVGLSPSDLDNILTVDPTIFRSSLKNQIIPTYQYMKSVLHTNENVNFSIKRSTWLLRYNILQKKIAPNLVVLRECGVPCNRILMLLKTQPRALIQFPDTFVEMIKEIQKMGFDPRMSNFVEAIRIITGCSKWIREKKKEIYRKWGWSDKEILAAFKKSPSYLLRSDKKIETTMDFLVNKMGWDSSVVANCPQVISHSLENWIVPRCLVYQFLLSKGLIKEQRISTLLKSMNQKFLKTYVEPYSADFPELLTIYQPQPQPKVVSLQDKLLEL